MLGIGITTRNRMRIQMHQRERVEQFTRQPHKLVVIDDNSELPTPLAIWSHKRLGVAAAKTACLWRLQDCDPIILLDDDIWPIEDDWVALLQGAAAAAGIQHLIYVPATGQAGHAWDASFVCTGTHVYGDYTLQTYAQCAGVLLYLTQTVLQQVGAFGKYPGVYGFEHAGYSQRIAKAGLMGKLGPYVTVQGLKERMWSIDFDGPPSDVTYCVASSLSAAEAQQSVNQNGRFMQAEIGHIYQPLYDPLEGS